MGKSLEKLSKKNFSVVFLSAKKMQELNEKYRNMDYIPNVLSFGSGLNEILIRWPLEKGERLERLIAHGIESILKEK